MFVWVLEVILLVSFVAGRAAGLDCARASSAIERVISSDPALSVRDGEVTQLYAEAFAVTPRSMPLQLEQHAFLHRRFEKISVESSGAYSSYIQWLITRNDYRSPNDAETAWDQGAFRLAA